MPPCHAAYALKPPQNRMPLNQSKSGAENGIPVLQVSRLRPGIALFVLGPFALLTACRTRDFPQYDPAYREYAYVTNGGSGTVSVYDVVNVRVDREIPVGQNPTAVAANPTRREVYVVNSATS